MSGLTRHGVVLCSTILRRNLLLGHSHCCALALEREVAGFVPRYLLLLARPHAHSLGASSLRSGQRSGCVFNAAGMGMPIISLDPDAGSKALAMAQACRLFLNAGISCPRQRSRVAFGRSQSGWIGDSRASLWPVVLHCCVSEGICSAKCLKRRASCWTHKGTLYLFESTHRAFPKIDSDSWTDAVKPDACVDFA